MTVGGSGGARLMSNLAKTLPLPSGSEGGATYGSGAVVGRMEV